MDHGGVRKGGEDHGRGSEEEVRIMEELEEGKRIMGGLEGEERILGLEEGRGSWRIRRGERIKGGD